MAAVKITIPPVAVNPFERKFISQSESMAAKQQLWGGFGQAPEPPALGPGGTPPDAGKRPFFTPAVRQYLVGLGFLGTVAALAWFQRR